MSSYINLSEEIDKYLQEKEEQITPKERDYFYVSEIGNSKKDIYKAVKGERTAFTPRVRRILENGDYVHQRYAKYFAEMGILVASEIDVVKEDFLHGRLDFIITDKEKNYVVEVKSCSQWTFNKLSAPIFAHVLQIQMYMYFTNIPNGIILYENKDNQTIKTFNITLDKQLVEKCLNELKQLKEDIFVKGIVPEDKPILLEDLNYGI